MFHIVYKTTNTKNNKIYIGVHSTTDLNDGYLGSGLRLKRAIKYHGTSAFKREILFHGFDKQAAYDLERELVTEAFTLDPTTYNLAVGGSGHAGITRRSRVVDIYDLEHNFVCSQNSYTLAAQYIGPPVTNTYIMIACKNAANNKGCKVGNYYVCWHNGTPCYKQEHAPDHMKKMHQKAVELNTGKSRPEHSELMKQLNKARRDQTVYKFKHETGITLEGTKFDLIEAFPDHNISRTEIGVMIRGRYKSHKGWSLDR